MSSEAELLNPAAFQHARRGFQALLVHSVILQPHLLRAVCMEQMHTCVAHGLYRVGTRRRNNGAAATAAANANTPAEQSSSIY